LQIIEDIAEIIHCCSVKIIKNKELRGKLFFRGKNSCLAVMAMKHITGISLNYFLYYFYLTDAE
jgi:hypothetical protein